MLEDMNFSNSNLPLDSGEAGPSGVEAIRDDPEFVRIEELIKGNTFSRDEISRLVEILNSKVEVEQEKNKSGHGAGEDARQGFLMQVIPRTPIVEKQQDFSRTVVRTSLEKTDMVPVGVGVSPIDVARAFMAGRTSEQDHDVYSFTSKGERTRMSNGLARMPLVHSPSSKPSICWPGTMVHNHNGFTTPQSQRVRCGPRDFPRTPYSRTNLPKSTTKLQADSWVPSASTPFQRSQASIFGQVRPKGETVDGYGSVGPIRRIRNKFASEIRPRGSAFFKSPKDVPSRMQKPNALESSLPSAENNMELGETSGASKYQSVDNVSNSSSVGFGNQKPTSSEAVKKILEHLDRTKPTPKEKEAELKLATAWRNLSAPGASDTTQGENISSRHFQELSHVSTAISGPPPFSKNSSSSVMKFQNSGLDKANAGKDSTEASGSIFGNSNRAPGANMMPPFSFNGSSDSLHKKETSIFGRSHSDNGKDLKSVTNPGGSELSKNHGTKPSLSSISINKPNARGVFSSENGPGFTFPFTASSGVLSEPPTPSIMPSSSSVSIPSQPQGVPEVPSFAFGTNKATPPLVFSFPSTSNAAIPEASDLKFTFGSDKTRLSFSSFGKDATCY